MLLFFMQWMQDPIRRNNTRNEANNMPMKKKIEKMGAAKQLKKILAPPGPESSCEEIDAYFAEQTLEDLEKAGLARSLTSEEVTWVEELSKVASDKIKARQGRAGQLNLAMSGDQLVKFTLYAKKKHIPPSTLARAWLLERLDQELKHSST
ncbi:MAG: hypothetical protein K2X81_10605 [Candidatus Obscuribacterales bacterium]|nr:hypothetical protein [Candidatus Obscuribacterales bacterium]